MAITPVEMQLLSDAAKAYGKDQEAQGNYTWLANLMLATTAQKKAAVLSYLNNTKAAAQATQAGIVAVRATQDTVLASTVSNIDDLISQL